MKVRATMLGYIYDKRRKPGDVFELRPVKGLKRLEGDKYEKIVLSPEAQFSPTWMEKLEPGKPAVKGKASSQPLAGDDAHELGADAQVI